MQLSKDAFVGWLSQLGNSFAGVPGSYNACPISRYLYTLSEDDNFDTTRTTIKRTPKKDRLNPAFTPLPEWAIDFIRKVDGLKQGRVTGKECLDLMRS